MAKRTTFFLCGFSSLVFFTGGYSLSSRDKCISNPCPAFALCVFITNDYFCTCQSGYISTTGKKRFKDRTTKCKEIEKLTCSIRNDSFFQNCEKQLKETGFQDNKKQICTRFSRLAHRCGEGNTALTLEGIGDSFPILTNLTSQVTSGNQEEKAKFVTLYLKSVEKAVLAAASRDGEKRSQKVEGQFMAIETLKVKRNCMMKKETFRLNAENQKMFIHCTTIKEESLEGIVAFISYASIGSIINENFVSEENLIMEEKLHNVYLNSKVVSGTMASKKGGPLSKSINFTFQHEQVKKKDEKAICVYWNGSFWSNEGCEVISSDENQTLCSCNHLSSFAILMASIRLKEDFVLTVITYVGLSLSLLCLLLAALTFLLCRPIQNTSTWLHLQLSLCLFLAHLLFLTGIDRTEPKVLCSIIAGALHYLYLASFTWMLLEGLQLFLTVRNLKVANYISAGKFKKRFMYPFGYGIPAVIVAVSAGLGHRNYGTHTHCWLNFRSRFIWSFMGPVFVIILINLSFYLTTLWILRDQLSSLNNEVSRMQNTRMLTFKAIAQLFILGCSWGLGYFLVEAVKEPIRSVIAYSFTIINVLQGVYIFVVHCLLNQKVREEYKNWFRKMRKRTETESYDLFASTTHSKTMEKTVNFPTKSSNISTGK